MYRCYYMIYAACISIVPSVNQPMYSNTQYSLDDHRHHPAHRQLINYLYDINPHDQDIRGAVIQHALRRDNSTQHVQRRVIDAYRCLLIDTTRPLPSECLPNTPSSNAYSACPYACTSEMFRGKQSLLRHIASQHSWRYTYMCRKCSYTTHNAHNMQKHCKSSHKASVRFYERLS